MSLRALTDLRRSGFKPGGVVLIVVGKTPDIDDTPDLISILPGDRPALMDWRPIVGLRVALFTADGHEALGGQTVDALQAVNAQLVGSAWRNEAFALNDEAKPALRRAWELLCL